MTALPSQRGFQHCNQPVPHPVAVDPLTLAAGQCGRKACPAQDDPVADSFDPSTRMCMSLAAECPSQPRNRVNHRDTPDMTRHPPREGLDIDRNGGNDPRQCLPAPPLLSGLTPRQSEVAARPGEGLSNKLIARCLGISLATVKVHVHAILSLTGAKSRTEVIVALFGRQPTRSDPSDPSIRGWINPAGYCRFGRRAHRPEAPPSACRKTDASMAGRLKRHPFEVRKPEPSPFVLVKFYPAHWPRNH
jgi:DNA-binding CsgD family transcriptional regulator